MIAHALQALGLLLAYVVGMFGIAVIVGRIIAFGNPTEEKE